MRASRFVCFAALALTIQGCGYSWQAELRRHAALQHGCPEDRIVVLADNGSRLGRQARVEVCGEERLYENVNAGASYEWRDITGGDEDDAPYVARPDS